MKKISHFEQYKKAYINLRQLQESIGDDKSVLELRICDDENQIPKIKLKIANISPEIFTEEIKFEGKLEAELLLERIIDDFIECSFENELINYKNVNGHFLGYVETKNSENKARFTLGKLHHYDKCDVIACRVLNKHNASVESDYQNCTKIKKMTK